ncbi:hypothetical protein KFU94_23275 [Chloroflexi bacterium TSY]|nr:hypothetical protein [Chloroflexi bacterium TSY]
MSHKVCKWTPLSQRIGCAYTLWDTLPLVQRSVLLILFLLLAFFYSVVNPPYEAPDEVGHFGYILHLRQTYELPRQQVGVFGSA